MADNKKEFEILSGKQQILVRPQMWVGSMDPLTQPMFLISDDHVERRDVTFIPAFRKIIDEILDNSIDALVKAKQSDKSIKVKMTDDTVVIEDNGPGIPVIKKDISQIKDNSISESEKKKLANTYLPEIAWTRLFSGTNFQNSDSKTTIGNHGIGSKATAIFSTKFVGKTDDGKHSCKVTSKNNLESTSCNVSESSGISGTKVEFMPDLVRFKLDKIEQVYHDLMYQRLICLSISFPDISFSFNGKRINLNEKKFLKLFSDNFTFTNFDRGFIGVYANSTDEFNFFTYVNGLALNRGGAHVDFIATQLVNPIRDKLVKKYKDIKPADIRNRLSLVVFMKDFPNPKFDSQTKETLTNSNGEVSQYFKDSIDFEKLSKEILKNDTIIDPIIETFKLKEEVKNRVALKQASKSKVKIDVDKYLTSTGGKNKYLMVTEGLSARGGLSSSFGRNGIAYYASRGVGINAYDANMKQILANQEFKDIMNILGLDVSNDKEQIIDFDKMVIATDADCFDKNTLVSSKDGIKPLSNIEIGDEVLTASNEYKKVIGKFEKSADEIIQVEVNGEFLHMSPNHKMMVLRDGIVQEVFASDLRITDMLLIKKSK